MALLFPSIDVIKRKKPQPTEGEWTLLRFLVDNYNDEYEVYFQPFLNGDMPDIVLMRKGGGVMIFEVKDWDLNLYELDDKKHWRLKSSPNAYPQSPVKQVLKYKENLFELHIENLLEKKIKDYRSFNMVRCAVYFHNANEQQIKDLLVTPYKYDYKYNKFLRYNINFIGNDNLNDLDFNNLLKEISLISDKKSYYFTEDIYQSFKNFLQPPIHMKEEGVEINYSDKQKEIIYEKEKKKQKQKRLRTILNMRSLFILINFFC